MTYQGDIIPSSILSFMTKSETRCYPFCSHPTCWQSLEREVRQMPHWMPPFDKQAGVESTSGMPTMAVNDILTQNDKGLGDKSKPHPPVPMTMEDGYLPALTRVREEAARKAERRSVRRYVKEAAIYEEKHTELEQFVGHYQRNIPQVLVWVPNPNGKPKRRREERDEFEGIKDITEEVMPKAMENEHVSKLKKSRQGIDKPTLSPRYFRSPHRVFPYDGLHDLLCLPKDVLSSILSSHTSIDMRSKDKVRDILQKHGFFMEDDGRINPQKLQLHDSKDRTPSILDQPRQVFHLDDVCPSPIIDKKPGQTPTPANTPRASSESVSQPLIVEMLETDMRHYRHLVPLKEKPKLTSKVPAIGLGLPSLPGGVRTTRTFTYSKQQKMDLTLGPVVGEISDKTSKYQTSGPSSPGSGDDNRSMVPHPPSVTREVNVPTLEPWDSGSSLLAPINTPVSPMTKKNSSSILSTDPTIVLGTIDEQKPHVFLTEKLLKSEIPPYQLGLKGRKIQPPGIRSESPTSSISTWPNIHEDQILLDMRSKSGKSKSGKSIKVVVPAMRQPPTPPPPSRHVSPRQAKRAISPRRKTDIRSPDPDQAPDDNMIVIRSSARSHDSLSMPPMLEEGAESDDTMSISACPPDHLDDSSLHVTPVMTSVSPVNGHHHWVKKSAERPRSLSHRGMRSEGKMADVESRPGTVTKFAETVLDNCIEEAFRVEKCKMHSKKPGLEERIMIEAKPVVVDYVNEFVQRVLNDSIASYTNGASFVTSTKGTLQYSVHATAEQKATGDTKIRKDDLGMFVDGILVSANEQGNISAAIKLKEASVSDKLVMDKPVTDESGTDKSGNIKSVSGTSVADKSVTNKSVTEKSLTNKSVTNKSDTEPIVDEANYISREPSITLPFQPECSASDNTISSDASLYFRFGDEHSIKSIPMTFTGDEAYDQVTTLVQAVVKEVVEKDDRMEATRKAVGQNVPGTIPEVAEEGDLITTTIDEVDEELINSVTTIKFEPSSMGFEDEEENTSSNNANKLPLNAPDNLDRMEWNSNRLPINVLGNFDQLEFEKSEIPDIERAHTSNGTPINVLSNLDRLDTPGEGQCQSRSSNPMVPFNTPRGSIGEGARLSSVTPERGQKPSLSRNPTME